VQLVPGWQTRSLCWDNILLTLQRWQLFFCWGNIVFTLRCRRRKLLPCRIVASRWNRNTMSGRVLLRGRRK
jgi:hypothetical protein